MGAQAANGGYQQGMSAPARPRPPARQRPWPRWVQLAALALAVGGCQEGHWTERWPDGTEVHTFRRAHTNVHVIAQGPRRMMVDAGLAAEAPALEADLRAAQLPPEAFSALVLTHGHADHAGGARHFQARFGLPVIAGQGDAALLAEGRNDRLCPTDALARSRVAKDQAATYPPLQADHEVGEEGLDLGPLTGIAAHALALPGHTTGSLVLRLEGAPVVLAGDLLRGSFVGQEAELHFYQCDLAENRRQVQRLLQELAPEAQRFYLGHFGPVDRASVERHFGPSGAP